MEMMQKVMDRLDRSESRSRSRSRSSRRSSGSSRDEEVSVSNGVDKTPLLNKTIIQVKKKKKKKKKKILS